MLILKVVLALVLFTWFAIATGGAMALPPLEYKWQAWSIVACGPIVVVVGLWEICAKVFGKRVGK